MDAKVNDAVIRMKQCKDQPLEQYKRLLMIELCELAKSTLSYFASVSADEKEMTMIGWSGSAMMNCAIIDKPIHYHVKDTGLWGDAIRERRPVITNDYPNLVKATKKGYPQGHVNVRRHFNLPIFENGRVVLVVGVGNKTEDYTKDDARNVEDLITGVWLDLKAKI
ncbi:MAG: GAF domain-containing protein [Candidatus Omnitrophica bacterium]|nr:GAF domain-containing protein [Candidatus Omnitrophota bacterium]